MDQAIAQVRRTCAYTNHTILAEALEKWPLFKEVQAVGPVIVRAGDGHVPQLRGQIKAAEGNGEGLFRGNQPAVRLQPGIGRLVLLVVRKLLAKQAVMIVQAYAVTGEAQRGDGIQRELLSSMGRDLDQIEELEPEPSLGNGGLGRFRN